MAGAADNFLSPTRVINSPKFITGNFFRRKFYSVAILRRHCGDFTCFSTCAAGQPPVTPVISEGPSCILVGPIETASQETLEALYNQVFLFLFVFVFVFEMYEFVFFNFTFD